MADDALACSHGLEVFQQYSGQCWSDVMLIFLLFAYPFGQSIQTKFKMSLLPTWRAWAESHKESIIDAANYKMNDEEISEFIELAEEYLYCLIQRYQNMRSKQAQAESRGEPAKPAPLRRCDSFTYSICLEGAGILASELLHPPTMLRALGLNEGFNTLSKENQEKKQALANIRGAINAHQLRRSYTRIEGRKIKNVVEERTAKEDREYTPENKLQLVGLGADYSRGYTNIRFGKFAGVLLSFLTSETQLGLAPFNKIKPVIAADGSGVWQMVKNRAEDSLKAIFCYEDEIKDYNTLRGIEIFNKDLLESIPKECKLSVAVSTDLIRQGVKLGGHAILFLQCESGEQFIYDDNYGKLLKIKWRNPIHIKCDGYWYIKSRDAAIQPYLIVFKKQTGGLYKITTDNPPAILQTDPSKEVFQITDELSQRDPAGESVFEIVGFSLCIVSLDGLQKQVEPPAAAEAGAGGGAEVPVTEQAAKTLGGRRYVRRATRRGSPERKQKRQKASRRRGGGQVPH